MKEVNYELCEKCEKAMTDAGVVGLTTEEMIEQKAEFDFGLAINFLKEGHKVARQGWNGKGMWLKLIEADDYSTFDTGVKDKLPWIAMKTADNKIVPWLASQTDVLAEDWVIIE